MRRKPSAVEQAPLYLPIPGQIGDDPACPPGTKLLVQADGGRQIIPWGQHFFNKDGHLCELNPNGYVLLRYPYTGRPGTLLDTPHPSDNRVPPSPAGNHRVPPAQSHSNMASTSTANPCPMYHGMGLPNHPNNAPFMNPLPFNPAVQFQEWPGQPPYESFPHMTIENVRIFGGYNYFSAGDLTNYFDHTILGGPTVNQPATHQAQHQRSDFEQIDIANPPSFNYSTTFQGPLRINNMILPSDQSITAFHTPGNLMREDSKADLLRKIPSGHQKATRNTHSSNSSGPFGQFSDAKTTVNSEIRGGTPADGRAERDMEKTSNHRHITDGQEGVSEEHSVLEPANEVDLVALLREIDSDASLRINIDMSSELPLNVNGQDATAMDLDIGQMGVLAHVGEDCIFNEPPHKQIPSEAYPQGPVDTGIGPQNEIDDVLHALVLKLKNDLRNEIMPKINDARAYLESGVLTTNAIPDHDEWIGEVHRAHEILASVAEKVLGWADLEFIPYLDSFTLSASYLVWTDNVIQFISTFKEELDCGMRHLSVVWQGHVQMELDHRDDVAGIARFHDWFQGAMKTHTLLTETLPGAMWNGYLEYRLVAYNNDKVASEPETSAPSDTDTVEDPSHNV